MKPPFRGLDAAAVQRVAVVPSGFRRLGTGVATEKGLPLAPAQRRAGTGGTGRRTGRREGVYIISVAARIVEMHPQTLRKYERVGLLNPARTGGMLRLYSEEDIARLRLIKHLVEQVGLNLAGVQLALELFNQLLALRGGVDRLEGADLKLFFKESLEGFFNELETRVSSAAVGTHDRWPAALSRREVTTR